MKKGSHMKIQFGRSPNKFFRKIGHSSNFASDTLAKEQKLQNLAVDHGFRHSNS